MTITIHTLCVAHKAILLQTRWDDLRGPLLAPPLFIQVWVPKAEQNSRSSVLPNTSTEALTSRITECTHP